MKRRLALLIWLCPVWASAETHGTWTANLVLSAAGEFVHAGVAYPSSSALNAQWTAPGPDARKYVLVLTEPRSSREIAVNGPNVTVSDLKAGTTYTARLKACVADDCSTYLEAIETPQATTADEYWRINGTGRGFGSAARVVEDGNVGSHVFKYGSWAGPILEGRLRLYYSPLQREEKGAKIAEQIGDAIGTMEAASRFQGVSGYGLLRVCQPPPPNTPTIPDPQCATLPSLATNLALFQAIPLAPEAGGRIRLFFEAQGSDGRTRIMHLDSQDGYAGRDFHSGSDIRCSTLTDYSMGGGCEPVLDLGVDVDGDRGFPGLESARQFKLAYPTRDSWAWDLSPGTFMLFTTEWRNGRCSAFGFNAAYAVWNAGRWVVQDAGDGCPKMLKGIQAPAPVHLGGANYKLYFNRHRTAGGPGSPQGNLKPMQMIYADGGRTGEPNTVEFEDWEPVEAGREIHYVFADGTPLLEDEESRLDDYVVLAPTSDPTQLIMYSNMSATSGPSPPFIGSAVLINP